MRISIKSMAATAIPSVRASAANAMPAAAMWTTGIAGALASHQYLATGNPPTLLVLAGLGASIFWKPAIAVATAATVTLMTRDGLTGGSTGTMPIVLLMWLAWIVAKLLRNEPTGLENSHAPTMAALLGLWISTGPHPTPETLVPNLLAAIAVMAAGTHGRIGTAMAIWIMAANLPELHKNTQGQVQATATAVMLTTPGILAKILALPPTWKILESDAATAKLAIAVIWPVFLTLWGWEKLGPAKKRKTALAAAASSAALLISLPIWGKTAAAWALEKLGRNHSLTGRTLIWQDCIDWILTRPADGSGSQFWHAQGTTATWIRIFWRCGHAHNTPIEYTLHYGIPAGALITAAAVAACLHHKNTPKTMASMAAGWIPAMAEVKSWDGYTCLWFPIITSHVGDIQDTRDSRKNPGWKNPGRKSAVAAVIAAIASLAAASAIWIAVPNQTTETEELWLVRPYHQEKMIAFVHQPLAPARTLKHLLNQSQGIRANHRENGMILHVSAKSPEILDAAATHAQSNGHIFLRAHPKTIHHNHTRTKTAASLALLIPLLIAALHFMPPAAKTITPAALALTLWVTHNNLKPTPVSGSIPIPQTTWKWDGTGNPFFQRWDFEFRQRILLSLMARQFDSPGKPVTYQYYNTDRKPGNLLITRNHPPSTGEIEHAMLVASQTLNAWSALDHTPVPPVKKNMKKSFFSHKPKKSRKQGSGSRSSASLITNPQPNTETSSP